MILGGFLYTFDYVFSRYIYIEKRYIYKKRSCAALHKYWNHEVFLVYRTAFFSMLRNVLGSNVQLF